MLTLNDVKQTYVDFRDPKDGVLKVIRSAGGGNHSGISVTPAAAERFATVERCVSIIANDFAAFPKKVYEKTDSGRKVVFDHPAARFLKTPNSFQTPFKFWEKAVRDVQYHGNHFSKIVRDYKFRPEAAIPFPDPSKVKPFLIDNEVYYGNLETGNVYPARDILHFYEASNNGFEGVSKISKHKQAIGLGMVKEQFQAAFYGKGINTGGVVTLPADMELGETEEEVKEEMDRIRARFADTYSGVDNFYSVMVLDTGMSFTPSTMKLTDAEFLNSRKFQKEEISMIFGITLGMLGSGDKTYYKSLEEETINYQQRVQLPLAINIEQELDRKFLFSSERPKMYFKSNLDGAIRVSLKDRYEAHAISLGSKSAAWKNFKEIREIEDDNELTPEEEKELIIPKNMQTRGNQAAEANSTKSKENE